MAKTKRKFGVLVLISTLLCVLFAFVGCGTGTKGAKNERYDGGSKTESVIVTEDRKIIYTADLSITVENIDETSNFIATKIKEYGGWTESTSSATGGYLYLRIRVSTTKLETFLSDLGEKGEVQDKVISSQDITTEYVGVERQIEIYTKEYEAYKALYDELKAQPSSVENTKSLLEITKKMQEASSHIDEYESMKMKYDQSVDFSTVNLRIYAKGDYKAPSYWQELGDVFSGSTESVGVVFGVMLKIVVALIPYTFIGLCGFGIAMLIRLIICKAKHKPFFSKRSKKLNKQNKTENTETKDGYKE